MKESDNIEVLNEKQKRFVKEYVVSLNATEAAKKAGYSVKNARTQGTRMLANANIKKEIEKHLKNFEDKKIADTKEIMERLTRVLRGEELEEKALTVMNIDGTTKIEKIELKPQIKDKLKAAELLGKRYGLFTDKIEQTTEVKAIVITGGDKLED